MRRYRVQIGELPCANFIVRAHSAADAREAAIAVDPRAARITLGGSTWYPYGLIRPVHDVASECWTGCRCGGPFSEEPDA